jgi:hypothetical protein
MRVDCDDTAAIALARACCPGLVVDGVLHRSGKSLVLSGSVNGTLVVAKLLTSAQCLWRTTFAREVRAYTAFASAPPPVAVPCLFARDTEAGTLVLERIEGEPAATDRYPGPLPTATTAAILTAATGLRAWQPPPGVFAPVFDYPDRFERYHRKGLFDGGDLLCLTAALSRVGATMEFAHGDLLPANVRLAISGPVLLDWEFTGFYLPAFDLAMLWVLLGATEGIRRSIEQLLGDDPRVEAGFLINLACILTRELRMHSELPDTPERAHRLHVLAQDWSTVRDRLHAFTGHEDE